MGFFYGNINQHIPRTNFSVQAVYPSRRAMQEDENRYWAIKNAEMAGNPTDNLDKYIYEILENEYVLIDYTIMPLFQPDGIEGTYFNINKADDDSNRWTNEDTFAPSNYHYTIWQKQRLIDDVTGKKRDNPEYVAIARLHSILPTFETWGTHQIDILEPLSSHPDAFGAGKSWWYPEKTS